MSEHFAAQGKIEINVRPSLNLWDVAAAKIIIEEAGGKAVIIGEETP